MDAAVTRQGAKDAWDAVIRKLREGNADSNQLNVLTEEVERAFEAALNAGKALGFEEANRPAPNDVPNDATWRSDYNNGRYPFVEALVVIVVYFIGSTSFCYKHLKYYNNIADGNKLINAFYFVVVTTMTIGYGDIHPTTIGGRINTIFLVLAGIFISHMGDIVIGNFKFWLKKRCFASLIGWKKDVTLSISSLVAAAMCIGIGMVGILLTHEQHENHMCNTDSFYLSLLTLATVGYGDYHFKLRAGRGFATIWILFCYPLFRESSHFLVSRSIKLWRYITTELLKKWVQKDIPNTWNTWWPYVKDTLVPNSWQWVLHHLSTN